MYDCALQGYKKALGLEYILTNNLGLLSMFNNLGLLYMD
jgi:hypothetical protein